MEPTQPFFDAIKAGDVPQIRALLAERPALLEARTAGGVSPLLLGVYYGQPASVSALLAHSPTLDLFEAAALGERDRAAALLDAQPALCDSFTPDGFTALGLAAFFGHPEVVELLLARGADVNLASRNAERVAPLHSAVAHQHLAIAATLLDHGADVNARQARDFTPLHSAAHHGQLEMVELLLRHGANPAARDADGQTPEDLAEARGHPNVAAYLQQSSAA